MEIEDNEELISILLKYIGLTSTETKNGVCLQGSLKIQKSYFYINLRLPKFPELKDFKMVVRQGLHLKTFTDQSNGFCKSWTIDDLLDNLPILTAATPDGLQEPQEIETVSHHEPQHNLYAEIAALYHPDNYVIHLNESASLIRFSEFALNSQHYLEVELPSLQIRSHSLPNCIEEQQLLSKCERLTTIVNEYRKHLEELRPFYESLLGIDDLCYVIQPAKPTTKHNYRIFVLRERVFLKVVISDPFSPLSSMMIHIIGPTTEVESLRHAYSEGVKSWDSEEDIQRNLLRIFNLPYFPMPSHNSNEEEQWICNICYSFRLESNDRGGCDVPIVSCDNPQCTLMFHDACLLEWFHTLSIKFSFLDVTFGNCPFCKAKISTSFRHVLDT